MSPAVIFQALTIILSPLYIIRGGISLPFLSSMSLGNHLISAIPITLLEVFLLTSVILTIIQAFKDGDSFKLFRTHYDPYILLFLVSAIVATFFSFNRIGGLGILKAYFIEPVLFFYALNFTSRKRGVAYILKSLIICAVWLSLLGVLQKFTGSFSLAPYEILQGRITAVYNSANSLALFIGPIAILVLGLFLMEKREKQKIIYILLFMLFFIVLVWTRSRGGLVGLLGGLFSLSYILVVLKHKKIRKYWYLPPILGLIIVGFLLYQFYLNYNFFPIQYSKPYTEGDTLQIRFFIWTGTINMLKEHPLLGAGLNGFKTLYTNEYRLPQFQEEFQYPHNLLLTFWVETGMFGLFSFLLLFIGSLGLIIRNLVRTKYVILGATLFAMLIFWAIHGVVDVPYFKNDLSLEFWIILALIEIWRRTAITKRQNS